MTRWAARPAGSWPASKPGATGPCWSAGPACTSRPWSTACAHRAGTRRCGPARAARPTPPPCTGGWRTLDPLAASRMEPSNRRRVVRALEVTLGSGRPFPASARAWPSSRPRTWRLGGLWLPRPVVARRIEARLAAMVEAGLVDEVAALRARPGVCRAPPARRSGYREVLAHLEDGVPPEPPPWPRPSGAPGPSPAASGCGGGGTPGCAGTGPSITRSPSCPSCWETGRSHDRPVCPPASSTVCEAARPRQRLPRRARRGRGRGAPAGAGATRPIAGAARHEPGRASTPARIDACLARRLCDRHRGIGADGLILGTRLTPANAGQTRLGRRICASSCGTPTAARPR